MICDVVFDVPVPHPFSYRIPDDVTVEPGPRVRAREATGASLKPLAAVVDPAPVLSTAQLDLARWIAAQSLSTLGSTCAALLPPPERRAAAGARATAETHDDTR